MKYFSLLTAALLLSSAPLAAQHPVSLDFSFGLEGVVTTELGADAIPIGSAVLADGKIAMLAELLDDEVRSLLLMRFHPNGTPDVSFGNAGRIVHPMPEQVADFIRHVKFYIQTGAFLLSSDEQYTGQAYIARFQPNGALDTSFGNGGAFEGNQSTCEQFSRLELLPNGRILAAGSGCSNEMRLIRLTANGSRDLSFGSSGSATASIQNASLEVTALALQPDGKILAAGYNSNLGTPQFITFRFLAGGALDSSFGLSGRRMGLQGIPGSILVQSDGKIVIGGGISHVAPGLWAIERYMPNGTADPGFGSNGRVATSPPGALSDTPQVLLLSDGKFLICGTWELKITMRRYHPNGSLDTGFGNNGVAQPDFGEPAYLVAIAPIQDKLLITASIHQDDLLLGRCTANGDTDETFGQAGAVITDLGSEYIYPGQFLELPDGRMVASAIMGNHIALVRYKPNGDIDETFGEAGRASALLPPYYFPEPPHISLDPQGGVIAAEQIRRSASRLRPGWDRWAFHFPTF